MNRTRLKKTCCTLLAGILYTTILTAQTPAGMALIPGGTFTMGSPATEDWREKDETAHRVEVNSFYIGIYEVTQKEYRAVMGANPSSFSGDDLPVESVTWYDAVEYCNRKSAAEKLTPAYTVRGTDVTWNRNANGYRLPTEAEWEYACRAGTATPFNTENSPGAADVNYYAHYPYLIEENYFTQERLETKPGSYRRKPVRTGSFKPNKWGLYDMHGNVSEWCWDYYGEYQTYSQKNPAGPQEGSLRVCRGGGWNDFAKHLRSAYRSAQVPDDSYVNRGFRIVRNR